MNRVRTAVLAATGLVAVAMLTGCSSGQIAQTSEQQSAVNGGEGSVKYVALRNVYIKAVQTGTSCGPVKPWTWCSWPPTSRRMSTTSWSASLPISAR
ncbi:putative lipoprotein lpqE [Mycobacterium xenopi 4042]|uniref:Putative lipoprotein lpqE n=1 Tax=Mycobacterium xenopi 4042 TaxID=1299334 RepID=X7ZWA8_MYCXE|nr:putative lipoprotein lpqE [Mycobacterium xenopi 4042]